MISLATARKLKAAGFEWQPRHGDRFIVPDRGLDTQVFVINEIATALEMLKGVPAISFHGTPEWALDYIHVGEVVWLPSEEQLRDALEQTLATENTTVYDLIFLGGTYSCRFELRGAAVAFHATEASEAYAGGLLSVLSPADET